MRLMTLLRPLLPRPAGAAHWPSQCLVCRAWPAQTLCIDCRSRFAPPATRCQRCALPVPAGVAVCGACLREPPPMAQCLAAVPWQWPWSLCIGRWKFDGDTGLSAPLAALLQATPGVTEALATAELVLPMPMSPQRLAERGYNPAGCAPTCCCARATRRHSAACRAPSACATCAAPSRSIHWPRPPCVAATCCWWTMS